MSTTNFNACSNVFGSLRRAIVRAAMSTPMGLAAISAGRAETTDNLGKTIDASLQRIDSTLHELFSTSSLVTVGPLIVAIIAVAISYVSYLNAQAQVRIAKLQVESANAEAAAANVRNNRAGELARQRTAIEFSELITSSEFRVQVSSLAWQAILKWMYWKGSEAVQYKKLVCQGFIGWEDRYKDFDPQNPKSYQLKIFSNEHFANIDISQKWLSEHDALSVWLETWSRLSILVRAELADKNAASKLLGTIYSYSAPFIIEFSDVLKGAAMTMKIAVLPHWVDDLEYLRDIFRDDPAFALASEKATAAIATQAFKDEKDAIINALRLDIEGPKPA